MDRYDNCISLISAVAEALDSYKNKVVFVGGAVIGLLLTVKFHDVRPTDDVDIVVEVATYSEYNSLVAELRKLGFVHDMNGPMCRLAIHGVTVDVMPTNEAVFGFKNRWYSLVMQTASSYVLPNGMEIRLITAPLLICTKLEAFRDRGKNDFFASADIEDIIAVINGRAELIGESWGLSLDARRYLRDSFQELINNQDFLSALPGMLPHQIANREHVVLFRMQQLADIPLVESFFGSVMVNYAAEPLSMYVVSMEGTEKEFAWRIFNNRDDFLLCLSELGITDNSKKIRKEAYNRIYQMENKSLALFAKWGLLTPLS